MQLSSLSVRLYSTLKKKKVLYIYIPLTVFWIILFILTTIPADIVPQFFNAQDKLEHFSAYFLLSILLCLTLHFQSKNAQLSNHAVLFTFILVLTYGIIDELHQSFIPGRTADITDWLADSFGASFGIWLCSRFIKSYFSKVTGKVMHDQLD
jgi:VanZ family protein